MDSEVINLSEFHDLGPLVMQARMKGRIKHALDDEKSHSLKEVAFDPKHNEIVTIGSEVEQLDGMSQLSMLSGEKSVEVIRAPRRGGFPTMASEAKKAEAAAKEAQRVAENERMIAICAARRKAKDAAAAAAAAAQSKSDGDASRTKSDESKSAGAKSDGTKTEVSSPEPSSVVITQRTQASTASRVEETDRSRRGPTHLKEIERRQRGPFYSPNYSSSNDSRSSKSSGNTVVKADESARRPRSVSVRRRLAHDGRTADGLGVKYEMTKSSRSSSSRTAKRSHFPEPDEEARSPRSTQSPNS
ncbi:hypothetical protein NECAME_12587 [Necator americanus]|uniref:Uncharacterized protein n=1 Tax=Necator americanus TaxID=51031 RepID=W2SZ57_NECAM|nr:hypothetical protein NECAME_12587 [Necator americanus]ETN75000.1 hypothetical protein NECAME_12587 [Necator americanus]